MRAFRSTVQRKLFLLLLIVGMVPAGVAVLYTYWGTVIGVDQALGTYLEEQASRVGRQLDSALTLRLGAMASASKKLAAGDTAPTWLELAELDEARHFQSLSLVDSVGAHQSLNAPTAPPVEVPGALFRLNTPTATFISETPTTSGFSLLSFFHRVPVTWTSEPMFLVGHIESARVVQEAAGPAGMADAMVYTNRGGFISQGARDGRLLALLQSNSIGDRLSGWLESPPNDPSRFIAGFSGTRTLRARRNEGLTSVDWIVIQQLDLQDVRSLAGFLLWRNALFGGLLIPVLGVLSAILARYYLRPVRQMHASLDRLGSTDMVEPLKVTTGDEFEDFANAFNNMAARIRQSHAALQSQMREARRRARQVALVNDVCQSLAAEFDRERLFIVTRERMQRLVKYDCLTGVVADPAGESTVHHFGGGTLRSSVDASAAMQFCQAQVRQEMRQRPEARNDIHTPRGSHLNTQMLHPDCHEYVVLPLQMGDVMIGALILGRHKPEPFRGEEVEALKPVARFLTLAVQHIELFERTLRFATDLEDTVRRRTDELEAAHRQLLQTERFAATGKLAANIAHEINNPLGIIKNYLRIHRDSLKAMASPAVNDDAMVVVEEELDRIARIVRRLLDFYRTPKLDAVPTDVNQELETVLVLLEGTLRKRGIHLEVQLGDSLPKPRIVPDLLRQVVLNLLKNAEEASSEGGTVLVATRPEQNGDSTYVVIEIADTGCGISAEDLPRIFEPFFTKKSDGQGTGLGLAVTFGIIQGMNGTITAESNLGLGTRFVVRIPAAD